jgi:class 3 adenylate cyclase
MAATLRALREHGRCEVCALDWTLDLSTGIELVFRIHPALREAEPRTYCLTSPGHTPHVLAQARVPAGTTTSLALALPAGRYRVTGRRLPWTADFVARDAAPPSSWRVSLQAGPDAEAGRLLPTGSQRFEFVNDTGLEQLVRVEQASPREDALPASRVLSRALFRRLFPGEMVAPDTLLRVGDMTLLLAELRGEHRPHDEHGSGGALDRRFAAFRAIDAALTGAGGVVVKLHGLDGVLATFASAADASRAAQALPGAVSDADALVVAIHRGGAGAVALGDRIDYFGPAVEVVAGLAARARPGELVVSDEVRGDAERAGVAFDQLPVTPDDGGERTLDDFAANLVHRAPLT